MKTYVHTNTCKQMLIAETIQNQQQFNKLIMIYLYNGILLSNRKKCLKTYFL